MNILIKGLIFGCLLSISNIGLAGLIINADSTTDTDQGLDFLHVDIVPNTLTAAQAQSGFSYGGFSWGLATVDQLLGLVANATGLALPAWNGLAGTSSNYYDYDMTLTESNAMLAALGSNDTGPSWIDGGSFGISQFWAHDCCDDIHINAGAWWAETGSALFVKTASIPEPSTIALLGLGLFGIGFAHRKINT